MLPLLLLALIQLTNGQYFGIPVGKLHGADVFVADSSNVQAIGLDLSGLIAAKGSLTFVHADGNHEDPVAVYKISRAQNGHLYRFLVTDLAGAGKGDFVFESGKEISAQSSFGPHFGLGENRLALADPPKPVSLPISLKGIWYKSGWDSVTVLNEKTMVLHGFSFEGTKPPDGYIFAGKPGSPVKKGFGEKAYVLFECKNRRCTPRDFYGRGDVCPLNDKNFNGQSSLIVQLANDQTVRNIGWLAVYCYDVGVNFGDTDFQIGDNVQVPAFLPRVWSENEVNPGPCP